MSRKPIAAVVACAALVLLSGCGAGLSDGDKKVCDAAYRKDAKGVYAVISLAEDEEIKKHAERIKFGTSDAADEEAMAEIRKLCTDGGYTASDAKAS